MVLSVGLRVVADEHATENVAAAGAAFVGALLIFQIYLNRAKELIAGPSIALVEQVRRGILMSHSHLVMIAGVVVMVVAANMAAQDPLRKENLAWTVSIAAGSALFLLGSSLFDLVVHRLSRPRFIGMLVLLAMVPALHALPMFAALILVDVVFAVVLVVELAVARPRSLAPGASVPGGRSS